MQTDEAPGGTWRGTVMPRVVIFSEHVYESGRRAGFHWLADSYVETGWDTIFVTAGISPLSALKKDYRHKLVGPRLRNRLRPIREGLRGYVWHPAFHPINLRNGLANYLATLLYRRYGKQPFADLAGLCAGADTIIVESSAALALVPRLRALAPRAFLVYRVSDDLAVLNTHPVLLEFERAAVPFFDLISIPSDFMSAKFAGFDTVRVHYHGLQKSLFDSATPSPYPDNGRRNVIVVGAMLFDAGAVLALADALPDLDIHLFGALPSLPERPNIRSYGERPFVDLVAYLQHADAGFAPYRKTGGFQYLVHTSNKMMQYTYCRLPILLPAGIPASVAHIVPYKDDFSDIAVAASRALTLDRDAIDRTAIRTWAEVRADIESQRPTTPAKGAEA